MKTSAVSLFAPFLFLGLFFVVFTPSTYGADTNAFNVKTWKELNAKSYPAALKTANSWITKEPKAAPAYYAKGRALVEMGDKARALQAFSQAIKIDPKFHEALKDRGWLYYNKGAYREALDDQTNVILIQPSSNAYTCRAYTNAKIGRTQALIADATRAIALDPKNWLAYELRGNAYFKDGPYKNSIEDFRAAIILAPKEYRLREALVTVIAKTGEPQAVVDEVTRALKSGMKTEGLYKVRADAYYQDEMYEKAAEDLTVILSMPVAKDKWKRWDFLKLRGRSYLRSKQYAKAEKDCTEALAIAPDDSKTYFCRADVRERMGKYKESIDDLTKTIKFDPGNGRAFSMRAKIYEQLGDKQKAAADRKEAIHLGDKQWGI